MPTFLPATQIQRGSAWDNMAANQAAFQSLLGAISTGQKIRAEREQLAGLAQIMALPVEQRPAALSGIVNRQGSTSMLGGIFNQFNPMGSYSGATDIDRAVGSGSLAQILENPTVRALREAQTDWYLQRPEIEGYKAETGRRAAEDRAKHWTRQEEIAQLRADTDALLRGEQLDINWANAGTNARRVAVQENESPSKISATEALTRLREKQADIANLNADRIRLKNLFDQETNPTRKKIIQQQYLKIKSETDKLDSEVAFYGTLAGNTAGSTTGGGKKTWAPGEITQTFGAKPQEFTQWLGTVQRSDFTSEQQQEIIQLYNSFSGEK